jgi:hypothetical protein
MPIVLRVAGLSELRQRLAYAGTAIRRATQVALEEQGEAMVRDLSNAAPRGAEEGGTPLPGDATGHLADSFSVATPSAGVMQVKTSQPGKLQLLTEGTGIYGPHSARIRPLVKKALYWHGALHPVRSVAGMRPNHFVYPILDNARAQARIRVTEAVRNAIRDLGL